MNDLAPHASTTIRAGRKSRSPAATAPGTVRDEPAALAKPVEPTAPRGEDGGMQAAAQGGAGESVGTFVANLSGASVMAAALMGASAARRVDASTFDADPFHLRAVLMDAAWASEPAWLATWCGRARRAPVCPPCAAARPDAGPADRPH